MQIKCFQLSDTPFFLHFNDTNKFTKLMSRVKNDVHSFSRFLMTLVAISIEKMTIIIQVISVQLMHVCIYIILSINIRQYIYILYIVT